MATTTIYPDVSENQNQSVDDSYDRNFFMFRAVNEFGRIDFKAAKNLEWSVKARQSGKIAQFGVFVNPGHVDNATVQQQLDDLGVPDDCVVMLDIEGWRQDDGSFLITGDHSDTFNELAPAIRQRQGNRLDLVWVYGNRGDLSSLWPDRSADLSVILASYSDTPNKDGLTVVGWQYTNGTENHTDMDSASDPFGACDHNILFVEIPLAAGHAHPLIQEEEEDDLSQQDVDNINGHVNAVGTKVDALSAATNKAIADAFAAYRLQARADMLEQANKAVRATAVNTPALVRAITNAVIAAIPHPARAALTEDAIAQAAETGLRNAIKDNPDMTLAAVDDGGQEPDD
jgi:hypothetical protein